MSNLHNIDLDWEFGEIRLPITITYTYSPGSFGLRESRSGAPLEPDEPASVEIRRIATTSGEPLPGEIQLTDYLPALEQEILTYHQEEP